jgi:hypothetical protein
MVAISPRRRQMNVASRGYLLPRDISNQESFMGAVMIKCPDTGRDIATGIVADRASFNAMPVFFARVYCPVCQTEHEWFAQQAWVCDSEPQAESLRRLS